MKVFEWELGTRGLRMLAAIWAGIPAEVTPRVVSRGVTSDPGVVSRCRHAAIETPF